MNQELVLIVGVYLGGAFVGVFYPYVRKWLEDGVAFDWRKAAGKAAAAVFGLVLVPTFAATHGITHGSRHEAKLALEFARPPEYSEFIITATVSKMKRHPSLAIA